MLTESQRNIVKATVPLLETGGETLITHFYRMMFSEYPQVRPLFNQAHQASGTQPRALANGVLTYARNIDRLEAIGPLAAQIINKHVALQILPEHYPIVGTCLLRAIREVLGSEIATDEVIDAWSAAYQQLADILIGAEKQAYDAIASAPGGWRGARSFRVTSKVPESTEITSFYLEPADGKSIIKFMAGQYIGLTLLVDGKEIRRNYSLSAGYNGKYYRISVKREENGVASNYLHNHVGVGDTLDLFPPSGNFLLVDNDKPVVLISGGVGITPTLAMLQDALLSERKVYFIHYARNKSVHAFGEFIHSLTQQYPQLSSRLVYEHADEADRANVNATGLPTMDQLAEWLPADRDIEAYFLGPKPFMILMKKTLREIGISDDQIHYEFFGPAESLD